LSQSEQFRLEELFGTLDAIEEQIVRATKALSEFRKSAPDQDRKTHAIVKSVPGVGDLIADIVISSLGDVNRFRNVSKCTAYAGVVPGFRESDARRHDLGITKEGPRILRWALVQAAWRAIQFSPYWRGQFENVAARRGRKKAIVAVARRLLAVIYALVKKGVPYQEVPPKRNASAEEKKISV